jgi:hypothetical protein
VTWRKSAEALSIQPARQFGAVLTGILPSQGAKTKEITEQKEAQKRKTIFTTEERRGAQRKTFCHRFALIDPDPGAKPEAMKSAGKTTNGKPTPYRIVLISRAYQAPQSSRNGKARA